MRASTAAKRRSRASDKNLKYITFDREWYFFYAGVQSEDNDTEDTRSVSTFSTNATADNLPGPGRTLDKAYQFYGRKLEKIAMRFGLITPSPAQIWRYFSQAYRPASYGRANDETPLSVAIRPFAESQEGPVRIAGLQSLIKQTQSVFSEVLLLLSHFSLICGQVELSLPFSCSAMCALPDGMAFGR